MGQVLHGCATATEAVRRAIQHSQESLRALARRHGVNPKTIAKWRARPAVTDRPTGPAAPRSSTLSTEEEAIVVAFRRHTLLPLDDCLYALQPVIPQLTRSALHHCLERHSISRLPETGGDKPVRKRFKAYPIGFFHIDIAEVRTEQGKLHLSVAIDRTSKFAFAPLGRLRLPPSPSTGGALPCAHRAYRQRPALHHPRQQCLGRAADPRGHGPRPAPQDPEGSTPYEFICRSWTTGPHRFTTNPHHEMPRPNMETAVTLVVRMTGRRLPEIATRRSPSRRQRPRTPTPPPPAGCCR